MNWLERQPKIRFGNSENIPPDSDIIAFIMHFNLDRDWDIDISDVRQDYNHIIKRDTNNKISSYREYLIELKKVFGITQDMPDDVKIDGFIKKYSLDTIYGISVDDVKEDLEGFAAGRYDEMLGLAVLNSPSIKSVPASFYQNPEYPYNKSYAEWSPKKQNSPAKADTNHIKQNEEKSVWSNKSKQKKTKHNQKQEKEDIILIDGDNNLKDAIKGLEHTKKSTNVVAYFSQAGAEKKFKRKFKNRPNITTKLVEPGNQAVDNQIKTDAGQLCKKNDQRISIISQDKGYRSFSHRKNKNMSGNRISVEPSVKAVLKKKKH